jgi:quercetin dioxygenase-like cupin family protein
MNEAGPSYTRVYADADGETHFEDVRVQAERRSSPTGTVEAVAPLDVEGLAFRVVLDEASETDPHNAPRRLLIVQVDGTVEVEVSDGETRQFGPGSVLLVEDTTGKGHVTRKVSDGPRSTLIAMLPS